MAVWKKVIVSGSSANLANLQVDSLASGQAVIGGGASNLTTRVISGSGAILASGGSGIQLTGSFSGSFTGPLIGTASWATNATTATQVANSLTQGTGVTAFTYNGSSAQTVAVSGASTLSTNAVTKWTGTAFANSSLTDNGTTITGATSIQLTGANSSLTGSFTGSFKGDGSGLTGVTAQASFPLLFGEGIGLNAQGSSSYNGSQQVQITVSGAADLGANNIVKWNNTDNKFTPSSLTDDGTNITGTTSIRLSGANSSLTGSFKGNLTGSAATASYFNFSNLNQDVKITGSVIISGSANPELIVIGDTQFSGSVRSLGGFTGSLQGTASWASNATQVANSLTAGAGLTGTTFNGSAASTFDVGAGALITVQADAVMVTTSSLTTNQIPKYSANAFAGSNISDTGTQVQIGAGATSGLSVAAGGITVTGNSTFNNNVNIVGDLTVAGTASFQNSTSLLIADRFALLASGSTSLTDGGIIVASSTAAGGASGSAWYIEAGNGTDHGTYGRWATAFNVHASASAATVSEYAVTVNVAASTNPSAAPVWGGSGNGSGNMWINNTSGDIFIYA